MVNLDKWVEIEHEDVALGDELKIVWTDERRTGLKTKEVHKGNVRRLDGNGDFYLNSTGWESGDPDKGTTTTIYRRKPKAFVFPVGKGAVVAGQGRGGTVELVHLGSGRWFSLVNTGTYGEQLLAATLSNFRVLSEGVTA